MRTSPVGPTRDPLLRDRRPKDVLRQGRAAGVHGIADHYLDGYIADIATNAKARGELD